MVSGRGSGEIVEQVVEMGLQDGREGTDVERVGGVGDGDVQWGGTQC